SACTQLTNSHRAGSREESQSGTDVAGSAAFVEAVASGVVGELGDGLTGAPGLWPAGAGLVSPVVDAAAAGVSTALGPLGATRREPNRPCVSPSGPAVK